MNASAGPGSASAGGLGPRRLHTSSTTGPGGGPGQTWAEAHRYRYLAPKAPQRLRAGWSPSAAQPRSHEQHSTGTDAPTDPMQMKRRRGPADDVQDEEMLLAGGAAGSHGWEKMTDCLRRDDKRRVSEEMESHTAAGGLPSLLTGSELQPRRACKSCTTRPSLPCNEHADFLTFPLRLIRRFADESLDAPTSQSRWLRDGHANKPSEVAVPATPCGTGVRTRCSYCQVLQYSPSTDAREERGSPPFPPPSRKNKGKKLSAADTRSSLSIALSRRFRQQFLVSCGFPAGDRQNLPSISFPSRWRAGPFDL